MYSSYTPEPERFAPLPPILYVAFGLLFLIPVAGQIVAAVLALVAKNVNLRSYSRAFLIRLAIMVVTLAVLAVILYTKGKLFSMLHAIPDAIKLLFS